MLFLGQDSLKEANPLQVKLKSAVEGMVPVQGDMTQYVKLFYLVLGGKEMESYLSLGY